MDLTRKKWVPAEGDDLEGLFFAASLFPEKPDSEEPKKLMKRVEGRLCIGDKGAGLQFRYAREGWYINDIVEEEGYPGQRDMEVGDLVVSINGAEMSNLDAVTQEEVFRKNYINGAVVVVMRELKDGEAVPAPSQEDEKFDPDKVDFDTVTGDEKTPSTKNADFWNDLQKPAPKKQATLVAVGTRAVLTFEGEQFCGTVTKADKGKEHGYYVEYDDDDVDAEWLKFFFQNGEWNFTNTDGDKGTAEIFEVTRVEEPLSGTAFMLEGQRRGHRVRRGKREAPKPRLDPYNQRAWYMACGMAGDADYEHSSIFIERPLREVKFEYRDHTADILLHAWGYDLAEAFEQCGRSMFGYMLEEGERDLPVIRCDHNQTQTMQIESNDLMNLLFKYMDELLSYMDGTLGEEINGSWETKYVLMRDINITNLEYNQPEAPQGPDEKTDPTRDDRGKWDGVFRLSSTSWGELFDRYYMGHGTDVKAITYSQMAIYGPGGFVCMNKDETEQKMLATHEDDGLWHIYMVIDI